MRFFSLFITVAISSGVQETKELPARKPGQGVFRTKRVGAESFESFYQKGGPLFDVVIVPPFIIQGTSNTSAQMKNPKH